MVKKRRRKHSNRSDRTSIDNCTRVRTSFWPMSVFPPDFNARFLIPYKSRAPFQMISSSKTWAASSNESHTSGSIFSTATNIRGKGPRLLPMIPKGRLPLLKASLHMTALTMVGSRSILSNVFWSMIICLLKFFLGLMCYLQRRRWQYERSARRLIVATFLMSIFRCFPRWSPGPVWGPFQETGRQRLASSAVRQRVW